MTNLRIIPGDRLDVEMVKELRKCDKKLLIFGIVVGYMHVHFNHKINKLEEEVTKMSAAFHYTKFQDTYDRLFGKKNKKEQSKED